MNDPSQWDVYLVTDRSFSRGRQTRQIVEAALRGGVSVVQLREKDLDTRDFYREGLKIRDLLKSWGVPLIVNDRIDIALALDANGVHLGSSDMPVRVARSILGRDKLIGLSLNTIADLDEPDITCADYLAVSPVFATQTKTDTAPAWGLEGLRLARSRTEKPLVAIGGISVENVESVIAVGADCVAVVTAIVSAEDPASATRTLNALVQAQKAR
jgi:thiamine-phosphate pyrophosphorylase